VHQRFCKIQAEVCFALWPAADHLAETHSLAAILLQREMVDAVLRYIQSLQSDHAVRDLVAAERLVPHAGDWLGHLSQEAYRRRVATEHRQTRALW
jgi:hypothetical protein